MSSGCAGSGGGWGVKSGTGGGDKKVMDFSDIADAGSRKYGIRAFEKKVKAIDYFGVGCIWKLLGRER